MGQKKSNDEYEDSDNDKIDDACKDNSEHENEGKKAMVHIKITTIMGGEDKNLTFSKYFCFKI